MSANCTKCQGFAVREDDHTRCVNCGRVVYAQVAAPVQAAGPQDLDPRLLVDLDALGDALGKLGPDPVNYDAGYSEFAPVATTPREQERAILGLSPDSLYPHVCDLCGDEDGIAGEKVVSGRWYVHPVCLDSARRDGLLTIELPPVEWIWPATTQAPACSLRQISSPLTREQIEEIASLRRGWGLRQAEIAQRLNISQTTVSRGLDRAQELGIRPRKIKGEQLSLLDWFGEGRDDAA